MQKPSKLTRRQFGALAAAAAFMPYSGALRAAESKNGTLTFVFSGEPTALVAITNTAGPNVLFSAKVTEGLLRYDFDINPIPGLATKWEMSPDGKAITFVLREGVKWHDGKPFTSADVAFSLATLKKVHPRMGAALTDVQEFQTPDDHTVILKLANPAPYLFTALAAQEAPIFPKHVYENTDIAANPANRAPVGTGPYKFKEWVSGSHIVLERNPDYWDAPKPAVDQIIVRIIKDAAAAAVALETGEGDLADAVGLSMTDVERLEKLPHLASTTKGWSYAPAVLMAEFNLDKDVFKKLEVRQAIAHAIDLKTLINVAWYGRGKVVAGPIPPDFPAFYPNLAVYDFDPAKAEKMLDAAGYPRGADGTRFKIAIDPVPYGTGPKRSGAYLKQALQKIGIEVDLRDQDFAAYTKRIYTDRDFDMCINSISTGADPTLGLTRIYHSKEFRVGVPFSNASHCSNPDIDKALDTARIEIDPAKRAADFKEFSRLVHENLPSLTLTVADKTTVYNKRVVDHTTTADGIRANLVDAKLVS
jgi:peptide/nickel transport system substrate-binding protein